MHQESYKIWKGIDNVLRSGSDRQVLYLLMELQRVVVNEEKRVENESYLKNCTSFIEVIEKSLFDLREIIKGNNVLSGTVKEELFYKYFKEDRKYEGDRSYSKQIFDILYRGFQTCKGDRNEKNIRRTETDNSDFKSENDIKKDVLDKLLKCFEDIPFGICFLIFTKFNKTLLDEQIEAKQTQMYSPIEKEKNAAAEYLELVNKLLEILQSLKDVIQRDNSKNLKNINRVLNDYFGETFSDEEMSHRTTGWRYIYKKCFDYMTEYSDDNNK